mgnify:CR=1 FL=1|jgi:hypothetical protein
MNLTFESEAVGYILPAFGVKIDEEGYVVDKESGDRVETPHGEHVTADELAMVEHGSDVFVDDNFASLVEHVERQRNN